MDGEKPEPKTWTDIKEETEASIKQMEMNLDIAKAVLMIANTRLMGK